jgi:hypothetical protein
MNKCLRPAILAIFISLVSACGGGSDAVVTPPPPPTGGIIRTGIAIGPITTFGSVIVNGVSYETDTARFTINDVSGTQNDLKVGHIVTINGTIDANGTTGTAIDVVFDDTVKGPVESIDLVGNSLVVLGQTVLIGPDTSFDDSINPASLDGVSVFQIVEVSGQFDANGNIVATRIEPKPANTQFEVHGTVVNLDAANLRYNLDALVDDFSSATLD